MEVQTAEVEVELHEHKSLNPRLDKAKTLGHQWGKMDTRGTETQGLLKGTNKKACHDLQIDTVTINQDPRWGEVEQERRNRPPWPWLSTAAICGTPLLTFNRMSVFNRKFSTPLRVLFRTDSKASNQSLRLIKSYTHRLPLVWKSRRRLNSCR